MDNTDFPARLGGVLERAGEHLTDLGAIHGVRRVRLVAHDPRRVRDATQFPHEG